MPDKLKNIWLWINSDDLRTERKQLEQEGRDISSVNGIFNRLLKLGDDKLFLPPNQAKAAGLLQQCQQLPMRRGYPFREPSDLPGIRKLRTTGTRVHSKKLPDALTRDRIHGAWLGRCIGCLLGKPVECVKTFELWPFLKDTKQFPITTYMRFGFGGAIAKKYPTLTKNLAYYDAMEVMPIDDDTNYTTVGLLVNEKYGLDFTPADVAQFWMENIPGLGTCTAERVAYRNFMMQIQPPFSATHLNPYREWIGAQIRVDGFAYVNLGNPQRAAECAWRDGSISHVKNGIYGEMFVGAMIAAAPFAQDIQELITVGLAEIPATSRLFESISQVLTWHAQGMTYDDAVTHLHALWDEKSPYDWCHTISNAIIVAIGLLWGEDDFGTSICRAVQPCFDTDCNGATVGSIMGMRLGAKKLPASWTGRLHNTLHTSLQGNNVVKIDEMAERTFKVYKKTT